MVRAKRAISEPLQQRNAFLNTCLSSLRAKAAQKCVQTRVWLLRRNAFRDSRTPCVDHHVVPDAWSA
eukprot:3742311-Lingulodinium_polyedra.AAC.1